MATTDTLSETAWPGAVRERRRALLQRVGMGGACALIQVMEVSLFWPVTRRGENSLPAWRLALGGVAISLNAATFSALSIPLWIHGGALGGICAAIIICSGAVYAIINSPRSPLVLACALIPQLGYMMMIPPAMMLLGADAPFVLATSIALCIYAAYCLHTWSRIKRASAAEAQARLEADCRRREAERAVAARTAFLAAVGHDLRTPLSAILTGAIELERTAATGAARSHAALIGQAGQMMKALLDDLLDHAKLDAGRMNIVVEDFNFRAALAQTLRLWQGPAAAKGLRLRIEGARDVPAWVRGDETRLRQILNNLLSNAVKFTPAGSVTVRINAWAEEPRGHAMVLEVVDTGPGMSPGQLARLFEPFDQTDDGISARHGGTGLGLAISRHLAELMGGRLTVRSRKGEGATFVLSLHLDAGADPAAGATPARVDDSGRAGVARPLAAPPALKLVSAPEPPPASLTAPLPAPLAAPVAAPAPAPIPEPVAAATDGPTEVEATPPLRVLVVDDHDINRRALQLILQTLDCHIEMAADGLAALEACDRARFDVIFMDVRMPELDGRETTRRIRAGTSPNRSSPVVAVTADTAPEDVEACLEAGMTYFVSKPVTPAALLTALEQVLADAEARADGDAATAPDTAVA
ncbi:ATP-binding protein [Brevundimonas sp.]|jgi:signal transduction histidine kinase/CheY-like chemotaxis protein|uniref:ATP-binding protein n=1 Tax=Brevundimonas sp. TaxID=1871086 RepID=UPI0039C85DF2